MADNRKVYSPDITSFKFEGSEGISKIVSYVLVAPFRIVSRVMHNIFILPANLEGQFADGLFVIAGIMTVLGLVDLIAFHKWVLLVSQLPLFPLGYKMRQSSAIAMEQQEEENIIDVDKQEVRRQALEVYDELDKII